MLKQKLNKLIFLSNRLNKNFKQLNNISDKNKLNAIKHKCKNLIE